MWRLPYIVPLSLAVLITFVSEMPAQVAINQTEGFGEARSWCSPISKSFTARTSRSRT